MMLRLLLSSALFFALVVGPSSPLLANYTFDGTNDSIVTANNAFAEEDISTFSWSICLKLSAQPGATQMIYTSSTVDGGATLRGILVTPTGAAAGNFRVGFYQSHASTAYDKIFTTDISINAWHQIGLDWNSSAGTDPVFYIDGSAAAGVSGTAASGLRSTGVDTALFGENIANRLLDFSGKLEEFAFWSTRLSSGNWATVSASGPSSLTTNRIAYVPLRTDAVDSDGAMGALTVTGATLDSADHCISTASRRPVAPIIFGWLKGLLFPFFPGEAYAQ
jgi:hypothetical protein